MKILIISTYFPPQNSIAALRAYSWAKYFSELGHAVTVLTTAKKSATNNLHLKLPKNVQVIPDIEIDTYENSCFCSLKNKLLQFIKVALKPFLEILSTRYGMFSTCRFPDLLDFWAIKSTSLVSDTSWDLTISSGGPYSVHRVAFQLKKMQKTRLWILDWRDLWTQNHIYRGFFLFRPYERYLEKKFHDNADTLTTVSNPLKQQLSRITKTPVKVIYNGFDKSDYDSLPDTRFFKNKEDFLYIAYTGTIYKGFRDPSPLFLALSLLSQSHNHISKKIKLAFAGHNADLSFLAKKYNIETHVEYYGFLERESALKMQKDCHALLLLESDLQSGVLTGKLFEYLFSEKHILGIGFSEKSSPGQLIKITQSGESLGADIEKIKKWLLEFAENPASKELHRSERSTNIIHSFSRKKQAHKLLEIATNLLNASV